jgi:cytochrome c peroxidase
MRLAWTCAYLGMAVTTAACTSSQGGLEVDEDPYDGFSEAEWAHISTLGPLAVPPADTTNRYADDARAAALGQRIFFERGYAGALAVGDDGSNGGLGAVGEKGKVSCASCHVPSSWFIDTRSNPAATSLGVAWTPRNAPSLVNVAYYRWYGWGGKQDSLWMQGSTSHESKDNTAGNRLGYAHLLYAKYRADYDTIFDVPLDPALASGAPDASRFPPSGKPKASTSDPDGAWEMMMSADRKIINTIISNVGKAIEAYERRLVSGNSPLDRYIDGDHSALTASARRGLALFIGKAGCIACHKGMMMTDHEFHNTGVSQAAAHAPKSDPGRYEDAGKVTTSTFNGAGAFSDDAAAGSAKLAGLAAADAQKGQFRTKNLRQIAQTAPYMHDGSLATLEDVVAFYNRGGDTNEFSANKDTRMVPLLLSAAEQADLVSFLRSLTGDPVPSELQLDTSAK